MGRPIKKNRKRGSAVFLIIEIALGIVLGFLILRNLETVLLWGTIALGVTTIGGVIYLCFASKQVALGVAFVLSALLGLWVCDWIAERFGLNFGEVKNRVLLSLLLLVLTLSQIEQLVIYGLDTKPLVLLVVALGFWVVLAYSTAKLIHKRKIEQKYIQPFETTPN